jgi:hypothetical protein
MGRALSAAIAIADGSELAHFDAAAGAGTNVLYFVANVTFSSAPAAFSAAQINVANGDLPSQL